VDPLPPETSPEPDDARHVPVLLREILDFAPRSANRILDATVGLGGHARALLTAHPQATLLAFDRDENALDIAGKRLAPFAGRVEFRHGDFKDGLAGIAPSSLDYAIADLGVSSLQLDDPSRGFSFRFDAPLDMRMDQRGGRSASDILNTASEKELERILSEYGEEPKARAIARSIVMERRTRARWTTSAFSSLVRRDARGRPGLDPSTRAFQALRIATNAELQGLDQGFESLARLLRPGGRLAVIAFHSLEDRIVKTVFRALKLELKLKNDGGFDLLTPKPLVPQDDEARTNPRARSAKLRVIARRETKAMEASS
jgi:16S rRNA (cytosine1402-N4)-methyltransferase